MLARQSRSACMTSMATAELRCQCHCRSARDMVERLTHAGAAVTFRVYDLNGDGFVSPAELEVTLRKLAGQALSAEQLSEVQPSLNFLKTLTSAHALPASPTGHTCIANVTPRFSRERVYEAVSRLHAPHAGLPGGSATMSWATLCVHDQACMLRALRSGRTSWTCTQSYLVAGWPGKLCHTGVTYPQPGMQVVAATVAAHDSDGDGVLSQEEFCSLLAAGNPKLQLQPCWQLQCHPH